jgi:hypothetical protein
MASSDREFVESPIEQGVDERVPYSFSLANWPTGTYSSPAVVVKNITDPNSITDVTSTVMPTNSPSISAGVFITSPLRDLTADNVYRMECKWTVDSTSIYEAYCIINATT